jgi:hypothetical protein
LTHRRTIVDLIASIPEPAARARAEASLPDRLLRAELPPLNGGAAEIAKIKQEIALDLAPYDAMHILACLTVTQSFTRPDVYSELDDDSAATIEWVASVLLERPSPLPVAEPAPPATMSGAIQRTLDRTRGITMQAIMGARRRRDGATTALGAIAAEVEVHDAVSRWPGYADQARSLIQRVAENTDVARALREKQGFDLSQALLLEDAVGRLLTNRFNAHGERTAEVVNDLEMEFEAHPEALPTALRVTTQEGRTERGLWLLAQEHFSERLRDSLLLTADDLAAEAEIDEIIAEAFLRTFSCNFGDTSGTSLLTGRNVVRQRPFVSTGDGRYLLTLPGNLLWSIRPTAEAAVKADAAVFHTYETARSRYTEAECARQFAKALRTDQVWSNAGYWLDGLRYEVDVLVRVDDVCIVVEAKAGGLTGKAWRGRKSDLERDLNKLLGEGTIQAERLATELRAGRTPEFVDRATGASLPIKLTGVNRVESVVVTLEGLGFVGLLVPQLREAGILGKHEPPWIVSLYDLEAIAQACAHAAQLTLFIRRRRTLDARVEFLDECDLWMLHLKETLDFSTTRARVILVDGRSDELNKSWMFADRTPKMKLDKSSKRRLRELDRKRPAGFVAAGEHVIAEAQRGRRPKVKVF